MRLWKGPQKVAPSAVHFLPGLTPKHDEQFSALLNRALAGDVPVYFAAVSLSLCVPFDLDYRPDLHAAGAMAISEMDEAWRNGQLQKMFVYQRGSWFVVSDDYIVLYAALRGRPEYVPCWVLGLPESDLVCDVQGPIEPSSIRGLLGLG